jgi:hypothetical protein
VKRAVFHPEANQEYLEALEYYAAVGLELGERFDLEIHHLVTAVSRDPQRFFSFNPPARRALSREFPYSLVYVEEPDLVWIVAVMHAKRRPGYWQKRVA